MTEPEIEELEKFSMELSQKIQSLQHQVLSKLAVGEKECVNKYQDQEDKFVDCMSKLSKKANMSTKKLGTIITITTTSIRVQFAILEVFNIRVFPQPVFGEEGLLGVQREAVEVTREHLF